MEIPYDPRRARFQTSSSVRSTKDRARFTSGNVFGGDINEDEDERGDEAAEGGFRDAAREPGRERARGVEARGVVVVGLAKDGGGFEAFDVDGRDWSEDTGRLR